jgi:hypothetical protein
MKRTCFATCFRWWALNAVMLGFGSITIFTVNRNLLLGRLTMLELGGS